MVQTVNSIVGLMCGSYNPVTRMHLRIMNIFREFIDSEKATLNGSVVSGIISPVNDLYHVKRKNLLPIGHRMAMVTLALAEDNLNDWVEASDWEASQTEWMKTLEVLKHHRGQVRAKYGPKTQLWMVSGGDLIESMAVPGLWADADLETISSEYKLFIIPRIGSDAVKFVSSHSILSKHSDNIVFAPNVIPNDDSSTKARSAVKNGLYPDDLLHRSVLNYIKEHALYTD